MAKYNFSVEDVSMEDILNRLGGIEGARRFQRGELVLVEATPKPAEPPFDFLVRVDRSVRPTYPIWVKKLMHPELECAGPPEYDLSRVEQWLHDDQKPGSVVHGKIIYKQLKDGGLATCLNLQDGLAIQAKGVAVFRNLFAGKAVPLWASVVRNQVGRDLVPTLCLRGDRIVCDWKKIRSDFSSSCPACKR